MRSLQNGKDMPLDRGDHGRERVGHLFADQLTEAPGEFEDLASVIQVSF